MMAPGESLPLTWRWRNALSESCAEFCEVLESMLVQSISLTLEEEGEREANWFLRLECRLSGGAFALAFPDCFIEKASKALLERDGLQADLLNRNEQITSFLYSLLKIFGEMPRGPWSCLSISGARRIERDLLLQGGVGNHLRLMLCWAGERFSLLLWLDSALVQAIARRAESRVGFLPGLRAAEVPTIPASVFLFWKVRSLEQFLHLQPGDRLSLEEAQMLELRAGSQLRESRSSVPVRLKVVEILQQRAVRCTFLGRFPHE